MECKTGKDFEPKKFVNSAVIVNHVARQDYIEGPTFYSKLSLSLHFSVLLTSFGGQVEI